MDRLAGLYRSLSRPALGASGTVFAGALIPGTSHHVGKDALSRPAILITVAASGNRPASLSLQNLRLEHGVRCRISRDGGNLLDEHFSLIQCQSDDVILQECFLDLVDAIIEALPSSPSADEVSEAIDRMAALFLAVERPRTRSVHGLWGELFLISRADEARGLVESWHTEACDRYDFASGLYRLEVKTSADRSRHHYFSLEQVHPAAGVRVAVASIFIEQSAGGVSLGELWDAIREAVGDTAELRLKIDEICFQALGNTWQEARSAKFDGTLAAESLVFYDVEDIPRLPIDLPVGISEIHFRSNLALGLNVIEAHRPLGPILEAILSSQ
jgi:hypothetical protein